MGIILSACNNHYSVLDKIDWIDGQWIADAEGNQILESWSRENDSTWMGTSSFIKDGKTMYSEKMSIRMRHEKLMFVAAVTNQNNAQEVFFEAIHQEKHKIVFENKGHDFPNQITYERQGEDQILAYISGQLNGVTKRIDFRYKRTKQK